MNNITRNMFPTKISVHYYDIPNTYKTVFSRKVEKCWQNGSSGDRGNGPKTISPPVTWGDLMALRNSLNQMMSLTLKQLGDSFILYDFIYE